MSYKLGDLGTNPSGYTLEPFSGVDAVGNPITVGSRCKVFRHHLDEGGEVFREKHPVGTVFEVDVLEDRGYGGLMSVGIEGAGWIHHGMILVL